MTSVEVTLVHLWPLSLPLAVSSSFVHLALHRALVIRVRLTNPHPLHSFHKTSHYTSEETPAALLLKRLTNRRSASTSLHLFVLCLLHTCLLFSFPSLIGSAQLLLPWSLWFFFSDDPDRAEEFYLFFLLISHNENENEAVACGCDVWFPAYIHFSEKAQCIEKKIDSSL